MLILRICCKQTLSSAGKTGVWAGLLGNYVSSKLPKQLSNMNILINKIKVFYGLGLGENLLQQFVEFSINFFSNATEEAE